MSASRPAHQHPKFRRGPRPLGLPRRLAAELAALGHEVGANGSGFRKPPHSASRRPERNSQNTDARHRKSKNPHSGRAPAPRALSSSFQHSPLPSSSSKLPLNLKRKRNSSCIPDDNPSPSAPHLSGPIKNHPKRQTALEKLCSRQHPSRSASTLKQPSSRTREEDLEDSRIAWLEAELGLQNSETSKAKLRQEFQEDGLEDLFDGLDELDRLVDDLANGHRPSGDHPRLSPSMSGSVHDVVGALDDDGSIMLGSESSWSGCDEVDVEQEKPQPEANSKPSETSPISPTPDRLQLPKTYIPPHLRCEAPQKDGGDVQRHPNGLTQPVLDPRLRRQLLGILNRVSPNSLPGTLTSLKGLYLSHPRAVITHGISDLILELVSSKDSLGVALSLTYAALVTSVSRGGVQVSGVEIGWAAALVAGLSARICAVYEGTQAEGDEVGKTGVNLLEFMSHLYYFQVIGCTLVYDFVRLLIDEGLNDLRVEGLMILLKASGPRLRHDDPAALKDIVLLVQSKKKDMGNVCSRTKFMFEALVDLKNNKIRKEAQFQVGNAQELQENLKKCISTLCKASSCSSDPLRFSLKDLKEANQKGKWWLIGAGWEGSQIGGKIRGENPSMGLTEQDDPSSASILTLARRQGMNTDVRKSVFSALMTAEDYLDAYEKINQIGLNATQQREIVKVLLHCLGNEQAYNPYYTMVGQQLASNSHSIRVTMQYSLWDFLRELGEVEVGGEQIIKSISDSPLVDRDGRAVNERYGRHLAWAYAWWIARGSLSITVLKPLSFATLKPCSYDFISQLIKRIYLSSQASSPTLAPETISATKNNTQSLHQIFSKALVNSSLAIGLGSFLEGHQHKSSQLHPRNHHARRDPRPQHDTPRVSVIDSDEPHLKKLLVWANETVIEILSGAF